MQATNLSAFFAGAATMYFALYAAYTFRQRHRTRFQTILGWTFVVWALFNLKDIVITFPQFYTQEVLNYILLADGWTAILYTVFIFELTRPGWTNGRRVALLSVPWVLFTVAYIVCPLPGVLYAYIAFLWCYAWSILAVAIVRLRRYLRYIRANYSNIDEIDLSWLSRVFVFFIVGQLAWLATSLIASTLVDAMYYVFILIMWQVVIEYSWNIRPITMEAQPPQEAAGDREYAFVADLERVIDEQQPYLNHDLTLGDLATAVHTNRTYLSNYFNTVKQVSFYDYINQLRIERRAIPMMQQHPEYTLEYIAAESGFKSISTFRRAFQKLKGMSPSSFRDN